METRKIRILTGIKLSSVISTEQSHNCITCAYVTSHSCFKLLHNMLTREATLFNRFQKEKKNNPHAERNPDAAHLRDLEFVEHILQDLVVLDHIVLILGVEIDLVHRHGTRMSRVHQLARNRARRRLQNTKSTTGFSLSWTHKLAQDPTD